MCIVTTNRQTVVLENIDIDVHIYMIVSMHGRGHWIIPVTNSSHLQKKKKNKGRENAFNSWT